MNKETFEEILSMLGDRLEHGQNHLRPISPLERLAITMRCLAAGSSQVSLDLNFRVSPSGVNLIIRETLEAIYGKHIRIKSPSRTGSQYFNYKGFYSIVLLAVVDADHNLILVDVGTSGSCSDGGVFKNSKFGEKFERGQYELPPSKVLNGAVFNSVILGDDGFPLKPYLMKPYSGSCKMENILDNHRSDTSTRNTDCESYDSTARFLELSE
ncbi:unnamed protein product [Allacma fusca]|uniref:DDE Tnp4 domain-containing protein n=1 Tax=Allacma fusca TaxID=39272 RepID=A0A8J2NZ69_9HEXA|nr:unnamed protein product [Allacma fusca]